MKYLVFALTMLGLISPAEARHRHTANPPTYAMHPDCNLPGPNMMTCEGAAPSVRGQRIAKHLGFGAAVQRYKPEARRIIREAPVRIARHAPVEPSGYNYATAGDSLVQRARAYLGTNPTGWRRLWCGKFMAMIAPEAASHVRNPNLAKAWLALPQTSPQPGAIAVMARRGGGHIGVVSGFDGQGNPIIISGNNRHRVREAVYPRYRVLAFVRPG